MKKGIIFIGVMALVFAACATTGDGEAAADGAAASRPGGGPGAGKTSQIPLETKSMVLFAGGSLDEYTTTDYDSSFTNIVNQTRYSASGALLERTEYTYQGEKGRLSARTTRDAENRIKNRFVYQYDDQGRLLRETLVNKEEKPVSFHEYAYDKSGNRISRTVNSETGARLAETIYTYNSDGTLASSETRNGAGQKISSTLNEYDAGGRLINQKVMDKDGQVTTLISAVWKDGREIENEQKAPDGSVRLKTSNEYGAEGELLKKTIENFQDESVRIVQYEYTFKPAGR